jgi:ribosomal silencing factor RsfS
VARFKRSTAVFSNEVKEAIVSLNSADTHRSRIDFLTRQAKEGGIHLIIIGTTRIGGWVLLSLGQILLKRMQVRKPITLG